MQIFLPNVDLALTLAMWERQRESMCENENSMSSFNYKKCFFIDNIDFSLEKCRFGAKNSVSHYVLRRKRLMLRKNTNFELEICVKTKKGRTALQPQASLSLKCQPVKHATLARQATSGHVSRRQPRVRTPLSMPFPGRSIERVLRDSGNSLK